MWGIQYQLVVQAVAFAVVPHFRWHIAHIHGAGAVTVFMVVPPSVLILWVFARIMFLAALWSLSRAAFGVVECHKQIEWGL
jgi:hypothetical protein